MTEFCAFLSLRELLLAGTRGGTIDSAAAPSPTPPIPHPKAAANSSSVPTSTLLFCTLLFFNLVIVVVSVVNCASPTSYSMPIPRSILSRYRAQNKF